MGLPSGVQWSFCNIGAEEASDIGLYFSWGNIEGHRSGDGYDFSEGVYNGTPAANIATDLSLDQDAAKAYLGGPWRMPSEAEFQELYDNCSTVWTTLNGVAGILFTSNVNGNTLFFPAAGYWGSPSITGLGSLGKYWSSSFYSAVYAHILGFDSSSVAAQGYFARRFGLPVRAVLQPT